ncbi:MAG: sigma factor-like helix-turn-helix DNA-binding protein, partial [Myxococcota bacterium]
FHVGQPLNHVEIAEVLGVRPGTIKSRIARARRMLKQRLDAPTPAQENYDERLMAR